ncbi:hypothetical protein AB0N29_01640 [Nocardioides sp. NPDC092400]|uniref:hypothetical protein n=1 Tax=Nocardioides sp. NPDC092400 TaxID=3155196 RepID=UPI003419D0FD
MESEAVADAVSAVPYVFTVNELLEWAKDLERLISKEEIGEMASRLDRRDGPALLEALWAADLLDEENAAAVGSVWSMAEFPGLSLERATWRSLFKLSGYTVDGTPADPPAEALTLYRGATDEHRDGWSWTPNRAVAARFADERILGRADGKVWVAHVEPWRLLTRNTEREEEEYVVDTDGLEIRPAD